MLKFFLAVGSASFLKHCRTVESEAQLKGDKYILESFHWFVRLWTTVKPIF